MHTVTGDPLFSQEHHVFLCNKISNFNNVDVSQHFVPHASSRHQQFQLTSKGINLLDIYIYIYYTGRT